MNQIIYLSESDFIDKHEFFHFSEGYIEVLALYDSTVDILKLPASSIMLNDKVQPSKMRELKRKYADNQKSI